MSSPFKTLRRANPHRLLGLILLSLAVIATIVTTGVVIYLKNANSARSSSTIPSSNSSQIIFQTDPIQSLQLDARANCLNVYGNDTKRGSVNGTRLLSQHLKQGKWYRVFSQGIVCFDNSTTPCAVVSDPRFVSTKSFAGNDSMAFFVSGNTKIAFGVQSDALSNKTLNSPWTESETRSEFWGDSYKANHVYFYTFKGKGEEIDFYTVDVDCGSSNRGAFSISLFESI